LVEVAVMALAVGLGLPLLIILVSLLTTGRQAPALAAARPLASLQARLRFDSVAAVLLWATLTAGGEVLYLTTDLHPPAISDKGEDIEHAFNVLMVLAVPVFSMVVAVMLYSVLRHRGDEAAPEETGESFQGRGAVPIAWFAITAVLTVVVMIYPGLTGLAAVIAVEDDPDLVVRVQGLQWTWLASYPAQGIKDVNEIVLPVNRTVKFEVTSKDVLHSFWIPGFFYKIDAVPGLTTTVSLKATKTGSYETAPEFRVQCAELCGTSHARMRIPLSVVTDAEFEEWVRKKTTRTGQSAIDEGAGGPVRADSSAGSAGAGGAHKH
jgi:cytochrome c oxidase subunit 2